MTAHVRNLKGSSVRVAAFEGPMKRASARLGSCLLWSESPI